MDFNKGGPEGRDEKRTKILVAVLFIAIVVLIIAGLAFKISDARGKENVPDPGNKIEKSKDSAVPDTNENSISAGNNFALTNSTVAPGIKITSLNGEFNPEDTGGYAGLSIQIAHSSATVDNKISYELYSSSGIVSGFVEGGLSDDAIQKSINLIDRAEFFNSDPFPADIIYWVPMGDEEEVLLTVRVKNMLAQSEFLRFGIEIRKNESGAYEMVGLKNIEIKEESNERLADLAFNSLPHMLKDLIPNKTCKISKIGEISNTMAVYIKPDGAPGRIADLTGQLGVTFNFIDGIDLNPITVYLDSETLRYLGYDKYDQDYDL